MRKVTFTCDLCGKEITISGRQLRSGKIDTESEYWERKWDDLTLDLHDECEERLKELIEGQKQKEKKPAAQKKTEPKKRIDKAKIETLYAAGRSVQWIADDMKITPEEVRKIVEKLINEAG